MSEKLPSYEDFIVNESSLPSVDELIVKNNLPSVDVIIDESDLPSVDELIDDNNLPSVDDYIDMSVGAGNTAVDTAPCSVEEEITDEQQDLTEIIQLINDVRKDIPEIPEIKYYDSELESILEQIKEIPEVRYYDREIEAVCEQIDNVKEEIKELPEPKYYDEEIDQIKQTIFNLPEVKYYDQEISDLEESFSELKKFVSDAPNYDDELNSLRDKFNYEIQQFSENVEVKDFDKKVEIDNLKTDLKETTEKIYDELKKSSDQIHEHRLHLKDDDRKLKKQILGQYNLLKENIEKQIKEFNTKNIESQNIITGSLKDYFDDLQEKISTLPEVKYYDEQIKELDNKLDIDINELREIVNELKETQKQTLHENLLTEPPSTDNEDPLTPLDQQFVTYEKLQENYQLFVNRVQQQLASFGGGGEVRLEFLDDIDRDSALVDGKFLKYQASTKTFVGADASGGGGGGSQTLDEVLSEGNSSSTGISVGISTASKLHVGVDTGVYGENLVVTGDARVTGILTIGTGSIVLDPSAKQLRGLEEIVIGIANSITIKQDSQGEIEFADAGGQQKSVGIGTTVSINTSGIITAANFSGDGSDLTGLTASQIPNLAADKITSGTIDADRIPTLNQNTSGTSAGLTGSPSVELTNIVGSAASITGIITATTFVGSLTGNVTGNVSGTSGSTTGNAATATALANARTIAGVSFDGSADISLNNNAITNGAGYITTSFTNTNQLTNGAGFITASDDITGNAATATKLETARNIGGVSFDGSAAINLPGVNESGNQNTSGNAGGLSGTPNITVGSIVATTGQFSGNVTVGGTLTYDDVTFLDSVGVATARSGLDVCAGSITPVISLQAATTTLTTTSASNIDTFVAATFRSAQYQIQITQGSSYHVTTLNVLHDGSSVYLSEFGTIRTGAILATFDADIDSGNVRVRATPASDSSTVFKLSKNLTRV